MSTSPRSVRMRSTFLVAASAFGLLACTRTNPAAILRPQYPELLRQAGIGGTVRFRIGLDSAGGPDLTTFQVLRSPNPAFSEAVSTALGSWRPRPSILGAAREDSVEFHIMQERDDSVRVCRSTPRRMVVCARVHNPT